MTTGKKRLLIVCSGTLALVGVFFALHQSDQVALEHKTEKKIDPKMKTLSEVETELKKKSGLDGQSKEWILISTGQIDKAIEEFEKLKPKHDSERRVRTLNLMGRFVKQPSPQALKAQELMVKIIHDSEARTDEKLIASHSLAEIAKTIPTYYRKSDETLAYFWTNEKRPGPRGAILLDFAKMKSKTGFSLLNTNVDHLVQKTDPDRAVLTASLYALSDYAKEDSFKTQSLKKIDAIAKAISVLKPLGSKLLASNQSPLAEKYVLQLLKDPKNYANVEAAAYIVGQLNLTQYTKQLKAAAAENAEIASIVEKALKNGQDQRGADNARAPSGDSVTGAVSGSENSDR